MNDGRQDALNNANNGLIPHDHPFFRDRVKVDGERRQFYGQPGNRHSAPGNDPSVFSTGCAMRMRGGQNMNEEGPMHIGHEVAG